MTALVLDDDQTIRSIVRAVLTNKSYRVLEAVDADEALAVCAQHHLGGHPKPASRAAEVTPDSGAESAGGTDAKSEPKPGRSPSASACEPYGETIEGGLSKGRNAKAIWQDLVDTYGFTGAYQSVKRFIRKFRGTQAPEACAVIETAPDEDYGKSRVMVRGP